MTLPAYNPPQSQRTLIAVSLAPILVLLAFTAVVTRLIDVDTALAWLMACSIWVVHEMHVYQVAVDGYNADYVRHHLICRSTGSLMDLAHDEHLSPPTRDFVLQFVESGRVLQPERPSL